jgi:hypothetical protein
MKSSNIMRISGLKRYFSPFGLNFSEARFAVVQSFSSLPERQNFNSFAIEFCLSGSLLLSFLAAGNAIACLRL